METVEKYIPKLALKAGLLICATLIIYFMLMKYLNLTHVTELRFLNFFILAIGLIMTFRHYRAKTKILKIRFLDGILIGVFTTFVSAAVFAIFVYFYFLNIDPALIQELKGNTVMLGTGSLTPLYAAITIVIEGICSGVIISFAIMQYYK